MLLGNKIDLVENDESTRKVMETEAAFFCNEHNLLYNEISAKTGKNVKNSFENLIESKNIVSFRMRSLIIFKKSTKKTKKGRKIMSHT